MGRRTAPSTSAKSRPTPSAALGNRQTLGLALCAIALIAVWPPTAMVLAIGMLPTFVAAIVDRTAGKLAARCVGLLNVCGVLPFVLQLWSHGHTVTAAKHLLTNVLDLSAMFAAAAVGWLLFLAIPPVVSAVLRVQAERRAAALRARQKKLVEEWGDGVANSGHVR